MMSTNGVIKPTKKTEIMLHLNITLSTFLVEAAIIIFHLATEVETNNGVVAYKKNL